MKKFYYLSTCSTCSRIMKELGLPNSTIELREIKTTPISEKELDTMIHLAGNAESLFSKAALKYRAWGLNEKKLVEKDYRKYILEEYTFLKRPVLIIDNQIYIGNAKSNIEAMRNALK